MTHFLFGYSFTLVTALVVIGGDTILKLAADGDKAFHSPLALAGAALYAVSAIFWLYAMRHVTLAQAGVAFSMLTLLALCVIGAVWFGERLLARELAGIGCALAAMVLMVRIG